MIRCSTFGQGYLNRSIILLLNCIGVSDDYFIRKQRQAKELVDLDCVRERLNLALKLFTRNKSRKGQTTESVGARQANSTEDPLDKYSEEQISTFMRELYIGIMGGRKFHYQLKLAINRGVEIMNDPMLGSMVHALQLASFQSIKKKARILLPDSCTLIGVVDETGLLEENEVFVQLKRDNFSCKKRFTTGVNDNQYDLDPLGSEFFMEDERDLDRILTSQLLITRNPCLNPGDLRLLQGVDRPELRHLFNVVVFSSKGERPTCNKMSGGDLDGDVYFVCWDQELIS